MTSGNEYHAIRRLMSSMGEYGEEGTPLLTLRAAGVNGTEEIPESLSNECE